MTSDEKLREIIGEISDLADGLTADEDEGNRLAILDLCAKALNTPRRNCDVGTPEEQAKRFHEFCRAHWTLGNHCSVKCPFRDAPDVNHCKAEWAQMPYEEE